MKNSGTLWFILNLVVGVYILNLGIKFVDVSKFNLPEIINTVVLVVGGALVIISGLMSMRRTPRLVQR